jgi:hypothetical protein
MQEFFEVVAVVRILQYLYKFLDFKGSVLNFDVSLIGI